MGKNRPQTPTPSLQIKLSPGSHSFGKMFRTCWSRFRRICWIREVYFFICPAGIFSCPTLPHLYELFPNMFIEHNKKSLKACPLEWLSLSKVSRLLFGDLSLFVIIFFTKQVSKLKWQNVSIFTSFTFKSLPKNKFLTAQQW